MTTDWEAVQEHLDFLGLDPDESPILFRAWCRDFGKDFLKNGKPISKEVDALLEKRPEMALGFVVNPGGGKKADITSAVALFTEDDSGASLDEQMVSWQGVMPEPGLSVFSGNKSIHHYWPLQQAITPEQFTIAQRRLAAIMQAAHPGGDADTSLDDPNQVMRVAGAIHPKTGNRAEIRHSSAEQFSLAELEEYFTAAEARFNIQPSTTAAPSRRNRVQTAAAGDGTHYKDMTAAQRHAVVIDALQHCPERGKQGTGGYPTAMRILAALVHEFGSEQACDLAAQADWSQDSDWEIDKVAASLEADPPAAGKRSKIWAVFTIAAEDPVNPSNPWICPWREQTNPAKADAAPVATIAIDDDSDTPGDVALIDQWGSGWALTDEGKKVRTSLCTGDALTCLESTLPDRFLRFNTVTRLVETGGHPIPEPEMERLYGKAQQAGWKIQKASCIDAVYALACTNRFDPIQDYLNVVAIDPSIEPADIDKLSSTYLGTTEPLFDRYLKVGLIGAVKRRFEPGCKFDTVVTLDGDGGIYKSEFWIVLASPDWHCSSDAEQEKDFLLILHGAWIYEQAELDYIAGKKAVGQLKNLITTRCDALRVPFGKGTEKQDRAGIMVGTVNGPFLRGDAALRRRFLVIRCPQSFDAGERIDIDKVRRDRDRIWKAAVLAYRAGEPCFLDADTAAAASRLNLEFAEDEHPWADAIAEWLDQPINRAGPHHTNDILRGAGIIPIDRSPDRAQQMELPKAMEQIGGWIKDHQPKRHGSKKARFWRKANVPTSSGTFEAN